MAGQHVTGAFLVIRATVPLLRQARGSIVTMASTRALQSEPDTEAYAAAKGALVAMTHALAVSLGPKVRANCILPAGSTQGRGRRPRTAAMRTIPTPTAISIPWAASAGSKISPGWSRGWPRTRPGS